uniref:Bm658 n=1 Tax=Brugia malayi TaxID=6279 RepID=A0A1I9G4H9_BRUMA|nr:Bm658 [Brugia malayi]
MYGVRSRCIDLDKCSFCSGIYWAFYNKPNERLCCIVLEDNAELVNGRAWMKYMK